MEAPHTRYATAADGTSIAYSTFGSGPRDVLVCNPWLSHLEVYWEWPGYERLITGLAGVGRVIQFDKRGVGLSGPTSRDPDLSTRVQDVLVVLGAAGSARPVVFAWGEAAATAVMLAGTYPDRVAALALYSPMVRIAAAPDFPQGFDAAEQATVLGRLAERWGDESGVDEFLTDDCSLTDRELIADPALRRWAMRIQRYSCSPDVEIMLSRLFLATDARAILPAVRVPTLVLEASCVAPSAFTRDAAARLPNATLETIEQPQWPPWTGNPEAFGARIGTYLDRLGGEELDLDRVLATVLITDIVDSTATAASLGDVAWRRLIDEHDRIGREVVSRFRGVYVDSRGDGLLATFDGPARAVRCAHALAAALRPLGLEVRSGAHTCEVERAGHGITGIGVHVAARVAAQAGAGEVWTSATVRDLTAGSGLSFEDAGEYELKGVPDRWHLLRVAWPESGDIARPA